MNEITENLIERPYQEIVDDILTAITGGVVNEPVPFDLKIDRYPLAEPARDVRKITGAVSQKKSYAFQKNVDFVFDASLNAITWLEGGTWPDDETIFYVDYFRVQSRSPLTDINVGSVARTLSEAISREMAIVYQQINQAYLSAFLDTASGRSLDLVVSILGIARLSRDFAVGQASFFRDLTLEGNISIPAGTLLATAKRDAVFKTTEMRTLQRGQARIDIPIRASDESKGEAGRVQSGAITELSVPIAGISRVTNLDPTFLGSEAETDGALRSRAKAVLLSIGKGTAASLAQAIREERAELSEIWDPNGPADRTASPGSMTLLVECEPEQFSRLRQRVEETRAAGVYASLIARYVYFQPRVEVEVPGSLAADGKEKLKKEIIAALQNYVDSLGSGDGAEGKKMLAAMEKVKGLKKGQVSILEVRAWRQEFGQTSVTSTADIILDAIKRTSGDSVALRKAVTDALAEASLSVPPAGEPIADRGLVRGRDGRATEEEVRKGEFSVAADVDENKWWVVLDMETSDIKEKKEI